MIIVFGSMFMDVAFPVETYPKRDTIVAAGPVSITPGGKGANVAAAAARTGAKVFMVGQVGRDSFGTALKDHLRLLGVMVSGVGTSDLEKTGVVGVLYEPDGTNTQIASPAANRCATHDQIPDEAFRPGHYILTGLSLPREQIVTLLTRAQGRGATTILNVSPIKEDMHRAARLADWLVMNQAEAVALLAQLGCDVESDAAVTLMARRIADFLNKEVIVTCGGAGVVAAWSDGSTSSVPPLTINNLVDTNGAGDCFLGFFIGLIEQGFDRQRALEAANAAAALSCQKPGAMGSYPYIDDVWAAVNSSVQINQHSGRV